MTHQKASRFLKRMHFDVQTHYSSPNLFAQNKTYFMVCNHMSYLDLLFLGSGVPAVFVTSVEMKNTPFLGDISRFGGAYFVERRDRSKIPGEVKDLSNLMHHGFNVFVFPEATSTHGMHILPFKKAMFNAAIAAEVDVLPICLRYEEINGEPFNEHNKDRICWYGDMPFFPHFRQVMGLHSLKVSVNYLEPISIKQFPDRTALAEAAYNQITQFYFSNRDPSFKPWPLPEKRS
ncbi:MAG: 1-acyl-sn-glycerol-3-phosphate acyltransferase [Bdellovibrionaceae bacterium]|nr:1-acyl-sn-glycerol-3-phosphate acyltransferase [Pseudobdellovibrionaceae bacterium]